MDEKWSAKGLKKAGNQPRASITFPPELYRSLEDLAKVKKVSLAWVVREAAELYVARQTDLGSTGGGPSNG